MAEFKACSLKSHTPLAEEVGVRSHLCLRGRIICVHPALATPHPMKSICVLTSLVGTHSSHMSSWTLHTTSGGKKVNILPNWLKEKGVW